MKMTTNRVLPETDQLVRVRAMILGFRTRTLTVNDHRQISNWLDESEDNRQLFEKWITDPGYRGGGSHERANANGEGSGNLASRLAAPGINGAGIFVRRSAKFSTQRGRKRVVLFFFVLVAAALGWIIYRINH